MRVLLACGLLASLATADSRIDRMIDELHAGRTEEALEEATPQVIDLLAIGGDQHRQAVWAMVAHNERYAGKDNYLCGRVLDLARKVRALALERPRIESRILAAEFLVLEGYTDRAKRRDDWAESWRKAAAELAAWHGGKRDRDWALVRAVQILAEGARLKGAPADQLFEEAKALVLKDARGESVESPAYLAYRLCLAERFVEAKRAKEADEALLPFAEVAGKLGGRADDIDRATIFNLAVALSRREGLGLKAEFKTTKEKSARMEFDLPVSRLWDEPRDNWHDGAMIDQVAPDGRLLRKLYLNEYLRGVPWDPTTPAPTSLKGLGALRFGAIRNFEMGGSSKKNGPKGGTLNPNLPKGQLLTCEGPDKRGREVASRHLLFEDKKRGGGWYEVSTYAYGERLPDDPLFDEVVASVR